MVFGGGLGCKTIVYNAYVCKLYAGFSKVSHSGVWKVVLSVKDYVLSMVLLAYSIEMTLAPALMS